jgi:hypothetical protein
MNPDAGDRALVDFAVDSKLRGCDIVTIRTGGLVSGRTLRNRTIVIKPKTGHPVPFEVMAEARKSREVWL